MAETIHFDEQFAIVSDVERSTTPVRVLKSGDTFAVFDERGDIAVAAREQGLYDNGTRFLSMLHLQLAGRAPLLLSSTISADNTIFAADLTNPDVVKDGHVAVARGLLHIFRTRALAPKVWVERLRVSNHARDGINTSIALRLDADFADVFEVRGTKRPRRGTRLADSAVEGRLRDAVSGPRRR
jgi:glycogen debranching enzyme